MLASQHGAEPRWLYSMLIACSAKFDNLSQECSTAQDMLFSLLVACLQYLPRSLTPWLWIDPFEKQVAASAGT